MVSKSLCIFTQCLDIATEQYFNFSKTVDLTKYNLSKNVNIITEILFFHRIYNLMYFVISSLIPGGAQEPQTNSKPSLTESGLDRT